MEDGVYTFFGSAQYDSLEGIIVKFDVSTETYDSGKAFTKITQLDFMSDDEYNIILQSSSYQKGGAE